MTVAKCALLSTIIYLGMAGSLPAKDTTISGHSNSIPFFPLMDGYILFDNPHHKPDGWNDPTISKDFNGKKGGNYVTIISSLKTIRGTLGPIREIDLWCGHGYGAFITTPNNAKALKDAIVSPFLTFRDGTPVWSTRAVRSSQHSVSCFDYNTMVNFRKNGKELPRSGSCKNEYKVEGPLNMSVRISGDWQEGSGWDPDGSIFPIRKVYSLSVNFLIGNKSVGKIDLPLIYTKMTPRFVTQYEGDTYLFWRGEEYLGIGKPLAHVGVIAIKGHRNIEIIETRTSGYSTCDHD